MQEQRYGGLSPRAKARAAELADKAPVRRRPPRSVASVSIVETSARDPRLPPVGTVLRREFRGEVHEVRVLTEGFEHRAERFASLSTLATEPARAGTASCSSRSAGGRYELGLVKEPKVVRCAIYTRKSTTEGLDSDFNTLDAQREAAEHFIKSQAAQGWKALPTRYDDGGFTGGNLERPALTRLMDDIERGEIDTVVVYKVDRLSRSLLDFARLVERFEKRRVAFVSITQHFDTSTSMGRLVLNILLSFAQFERELISERTRDKIAAAKRRGKWTGGPLVLGYRVDRQRRALEVVPEEAAIVKLVFELYERTLSIALTSQRLERAASRCGHAWPSWNDPRAPFNKNAVHRLLRNRSTSARSATTTTCSSASTSPSLPPTSSSACSAPSTCARQEPARDARDGASRC